MKIKIICNCGNIMQTSTVYNFRICEKCRDCYNVISGKKESPQSDFRVVYT